MAVNVEQYRKTFFEETSEHLAEVEAGLLGLEHDPDDASLLDQVFRGIHSIKGGAATFDLPSVAEFSHSLENHLDELRSGVLRIDSESSEALLRSIDCLRALVDAAQAEEPLTADLVESIAEITGVLSQSGASSKKSESARSPISSVGQTRTWQITFEPGPDAFQNGLDPTLIWRELDGLGDLQVHLNASRIPDLHDLDPTTCYLGWDASLTTDRPEEEIQQAFFFHVEDAKLRIESAIDTQPENGQLRQTFGYWLVQRGVVTAEQMLSTLDLQRQKQLPLGYIALNEGVMTAEQVFETLEWGTWNGKRFGDSAIERGHLTANSLAELLDIQARALPPICDLLMQKDVVSIDVLAQEMIEFRDSGGVVISHEEYTGAEECAELEQSATPEPTVEDSGPAVNLPMLKQNGELIADFMSDCEEHFENAEQQALLIEQDATAEEPLHALYRAFHTIKGVSSFLGLTQITNLAHAAEDVLNLARDGKLRLDGDVLELVLVSLDNLRRLVAGVPNLLDCEQSPPSDSEASALAAKLRAVANGEKPKVLETSAAAEPHKEDSAGAVSQPADNITGKEGGATAVSQSKSQEEQVSRKGQSHSHEVKETVRVDRCRLDQLVDMIGELVIGGAMVHQEFSERHPGEEVESIEHLGRTVRELQEMSLSLRMVPIAATFQKMHRIVRDVSRKLGKQVRFEVEGEDTELDKTMVDQLGDPLMHMVRNAVDHGIELPDVRSEASKPTEGHVILRAYLRNGNFYIELTDDGRGLDREAILNKAVQRGVVDAADCESMADSDVWMLIFAPGFSTAAVVTDVSGRGVGMDVVKRGIDALNGSIEIESSTGHGSTFRVRLPLTMAIVDGLSVSLGNETFILPLVSVVESIQPQPHEVKTVMGRGEVVQVREETIPLVRLHRVFNRPAQETDPSRALVVIVETDGRRLALLVDELLGQVQAVMKSLETNYEKVPGVAGATILGNGEVAFILDVAGIARLHANESPQLQIVSCGDQGSTT